MFPEEIVQKNGSETLWHACVARQGSPAHGPLMPPLELPSVTEQCLIPAVCVSISECSLLYR